MLIFALWAFLLTTLAASSLWLIGWIATARRHASQALLLPPCPDRPPSRDDPALEIFVPAHNEGRHIQACLDRLLAQNYGNMRITVVDDRSTDDTGDRVRGVMKHEPRVRLARIDRLPPGWVGKTHALSVGAGNTDADYLLFVDGDCRLTSGAIAAVMQRAIAERVDFVSLWPRLELASPAERLITPPGLWLLAIWEGATGQYRKQGRQVVGNGQFLLMSREAYRRIGGHAAVAAELAEDAALARLAAKADMTCRDWFGTGLYVTTRTNGYRKTCHALMRVLMGTLASPRKMLLSQHILIGGCCLPLLAAPLGAFCAWQFGVRLGWWLAGAAAGQIVIMQLALPAMFRDVLARRGSFLQFPIGALVCLYVTTRAWLIMTGRGVVRWGATGYRVRGSRIVFAEAETPGDGAPATSTITGASA